MTTGPGDHHNRRPTGGVCLYSKLIRCNDYPTWVAPTEPPREANTQKGVLRESGDAPPAAGGASRFRGSGTIGGPDQGPGIVMPQRWDISPPRRRAPFCADKKGRKSRLEPAVLRTPLALTCTGSLVLLAEQALLSAGGRCDCLRARALSALAWWVDELPTIPHRTTNRQSKSGAATTGPGVYHNRMPTGGVRLYSKLIRCNDYPTSVAPTEPPREANLQKGFLGQRPKPTFGDFCLATKVTRARGRETAALRKHAGGMFFA